MTTRSHLNRLAFSLLALLAIALPSTALAATRSLPASACQTTRDSFEGIRRSSPSTSLRSTQGDYSISCPVVRDNTADTGNTLQAFELRVNKGDATSRTCRLLVLDGYGSILVNSATSISGTGIKVASWGVLNVTGLTSSTYYNMSCSLGGNDVALSLYWNEQDQPAGTDKKAVPGSYCKQAAGMYGLRRTAEAIYADSSPFDEVQLHCSPLRDTPDSSGFRRIDLRFYTENPSGFGCDAILADDDSNYIKSVTKFASNTGISSFTWSNFTSTDSNTHNAHAGLECWGTVSGNDRIYSVYWEED